MIRLEHLNMVVTDIDAMVKFYGAAFPHWSVRLRGEGEWYGRQRRWLHFGDDNNYLTFNDDGDEPIRQLGGHQVGVAHFGYVIDNMDALVERMTAAGYKMSHTGREEPFRKNTYYIDPAGFEVEFVQYLSDLPEERNRPSDE